MAVRSRRYAVYVLALLTGINFFNYVDRLVIVTMYPDLRRIFGFTDAELGALWFAFFVVQALATLPLGWAADRFDRRKVIGVGVIVWSFATLGSAWAGGFVSMLVLRGMVGVGEAAYGSPANALLCEVYPDKKARVVGIFNVGMLVGAVVGLGVGGLLGFPRAFQLVAVPGLVFGVLVLFLKVSPRRADAPRQVVSWTTMLKDGLRTLNVPTLKLLLPAGILISFAAGGYITWIFEFTERYKVSAIDQLLAPLAFTHTWELHAKTTAVYALITLTGGVLGVFAGGLVADRLMRRSPAGRVLAMAIGFLSAVPFSILIIVLDTGVPYFVASWLLMFFIPWYNGPMAAIIDDVVDDRNAATAQATFILFLHTLGTGPAGFAMPLLSSWLGLRTAFLVPSAALLGAGVFTLLASRRVGGDMRRRGSKPAAPVK